MADALFGAGRLDHARGVRLGQLLLFLLTLGITLRLCLRQLLDALERGCHRRLRGDICRQTGALMRRVAAIALHDEEVGGGIATALAEQHIVYARELLLLGECQEAGADVAVLGAEGSEVGHLLVKLIEASVIGVGWIGGVPLKGWASCVRSPFCEIHH